MKSGQHLLGSWKNTKDSREKLGANLSVIYITLPFSWAIIHLSASVIDEGRRTSYASLTQVAGGWLPDERRNRWLPGRRSQRAAGHLADLWLRTSHVSQNFLLDCIRLGMLHTPLCVNHTHTWMHEVSQTWSSSVCIGGLGSMLESSWYVPRLENQLVPVSWILSAFSFGIIGYAVVHDGERASTVPANTLQATLWTHRKDVVLALTTKISRQEWDGKTIQHFGRNQ